MKYLIFFISLIALAEDISGPVGALPLADHSTSQAIFSWDKTNVYKSGFKSGVATTDMLYTWPIVDAVGCVHSNGSLVLTIDPTCSGSSGLPFSDNLTIFKNNADNTKLAKVDLSLITTGTTRTYTFQNASYTIAGINFANTFSANQTFTGDILTSTGRVIGTGANPFQNVRMENAEVVWLATGATYKFTMVSPTGIDLKDPGGTTRLEFDSNAVPGPSFFYTGHLFPNADNLYDLGFPAVQRFRDLNLSRNINMAGTFTDSSLAGSGTKCAQFNNSGVLSLAAGTCASSTYTGSLPIDITATVVSCPTCDTTNTNQLISGSKTWNANQTYNADILYGSSGHVIGTGASPLGNIRTQNVEVVWAATGATFKWVNTAATQLALNDPGGTQRFQMDTNATHIGGCPCGIFFFKGNLDPDVDGVWDLGFFIQRWRDLNLSRNIALNGTITGATNIPTFGGTNTFTGPNTWSGSSNTISGAFTVTGSFYLRTFTGGDAPCSTGPVANGWIGLRTDTNELQVCNGGVTKKAALL